MELKETDRSGCFPKPYTHRKAQCSHHSVCTNAMSAARPQIEGGLSDAVVILYTAPHHLGKEKPVLD